MVIAAKRRAVSISVPKLPASGRGSNGPQTLQRPWGPTPCLAWLLVAQGSREIRPHVGGWEKALTLWERDSLFHFLPIFPSQVHGSASGDGFFQGQIQLACLSP